MTCTPKILVFAGSLRADSYNKKLAVIAAAAAEDLGAKVSYIDLGDFTLPLFDGDIEGNDGIPDNALRLKELFKAHDGLIIASPEYNGSVTGVLKNTLDWVSIRGQGEKPLEAFDGKVAAIVSTSTGALGGLRGLIHLRQILEYMRVVVINEQVVVPKAAAALDSDGLLADKRKQAAIDNLAAKLIETTIKLKS